MKIAFFSNYLNIHQLPFCEEVIHYVGADNFRFVANAKMDADRIQMGFEDMNETKSFVVRAYEGGPELELAYYLADESDVAIFGSCSKPFQKRRLAKNKFSFRYNERIFKQGLIELLDPRVQLRYRDLFTRYRNNNLYVLCASAYTKADLMFLGFPYKKCYKWGYFPEMKKYPCFEYLRKIKTNQKCISILWAGRLIRWKHPEVAVFVAKHLKDRCIDFSMTIVGEGPLRPMIEKKISSLGLSDQVKMHGAQPHDVVLKMMETASIFLFTSDRNEGWGAVLNEAMNAGCAIVADKSIGSVPFLIADGINGLTYSTGHRNQINVAIDRVVNNENFRVSLGEEAWNTINKEWSVENATAKLFELIDCLLNKRISTNKKGPCSMA